MTPLETYLTSLREIRSSGEAVNETSYCGALETFFNEIGRGLKPKVRCVLQLKNRGAGNPDGGLFTEKQLKKRKGEEDLYLRIDTLPRVFPMNLIGAWTN